MTTEAYQKEIQRLRENMVAQARRYLADADEAEDTVQDAMLRLWQMHEQLRLPLDGLASVLVRNLCIDKLRRRQQVVSIGEYVIADTPEDHERVERLMTVVDGLPDFQQTILRLRHLEGMEMKDIARLMNMTEVAVRKALSRARMAVRKRFTDEY